LVPLEFYADMNGSFLLRFGGSLPVAQLAGKAVQQKYIWTDLLCRQVNEENYILKSLTSCAVHPTFFE